MGHWEIEDIIYTTADDAASRMEFKIYYTGTNIVDAYENLQKAIKSLTYKMSDSHYMDLNPYYSINPYDIRSASFSLKPDAIDIRKKIKKVIFNDPATIIIWKDGEKTVVKAGEGEEYDPEKGLAMAISKYALGNEGNYYETFKKWLPEKKTKTITLDGDKNVSTITRDIRKDLEDLFSNQFSQFMNPPEEEK